MVDEAPSSPLSSPPRSVINVAIHSPLEEENENKDKVPGEEPAVEPTETTASQPTADVSGQVEAEGSGPNAADNSPQPVTQKRKGSVSQKPLPKKKPRLVLSKKSARERKWEAPFVYTDEKSPLANADLRAILLHPEAWDILTPEERQDVLAKFPDKTHILAADTPDARPDTISLRNDDNFRHDCARYCENIRLGQHDEEWLSQAWIAHEKHKRGDYDEFLRQQFEEDWDIKLPDPTRVAGSEPDGGPNPGSAVAAPESSESATRKSLDAPPAERGIKASPQPPEPAATNGSPRKPQSGGGATEGGSETATGNCKPNASLTDQPTLQPPNDGPSTVAAQSD